MRLEEEWELDCSFGIDKLARFRINAFLQVNGVEAVMRVIPSKIPTPEEIDLTPAMTDLAKLPRGLVLVTGPTGSGKSTTLACIMELVNKKYHKTILTIEDPIEFVYESKSCLIMIDTSQAIAEEALKCLIKNGLEKKRGKGSIKVYASDDPARFGRLAANIVGKPLGKVLLKKFR